MPIKKQEFYEGAALHLVARTGQVASIRYEAPFFILNDRVSILLKYSTKNRSPWGFTFAVDEQLLLKKRATRSDTVIGLICGKDGIATVSYDSYATVAGLRRSALHIACHRQHNEYYAVSGPDGRINQKIPPSSWQRILESKASNT
jgi:hypothetical protein